MIQYEANKIANHLYQGGFPPPGDVLSKNGIDVLVLCAAEHQNASAHEGVEVILAPGDDTMAIPINENHLNAWKAASDVVVERVKEGKNVLVTCMAGHNRSGIVVGLALAKLTGAPGEQVVKHIQNCRVHSLNNDTFAKYIEDTFPPKT